MKNNNFKKVILVILGGLIFCQTSFAETEIKQSKGEIIYVPVYSHVFSGDKALPFNLAAMLSIRNVDINNKLHITAIDYFDNDGKLLKNYVKDPIILGPLASNHVFIKESDIGGGFGANFIVKWEALKEINSPIVETIMIGAKSGQGISFKSEGRVITEKNK